MTVIVTDIKYRSSLAIIRDLGEAGYDITGARRDDGSPPLGLYSKHVSRRVTLPNEEEEYLDALFALCAESCKSGEKPVIFPAGASTLSLLAKNADRLSFVAGFCVPDVSSLELAGDKRRLLKLAASIGIPCPGQYSPPFDDACFPAVVKLRCGEELGLKPAERYALAGGMETLREHYARFEKLQSAPLVQEYVAGDGYGVSCLFSQKGEPVDIFCHKRIREYPVTGGPSSCCEAVWNKNMAEDAVRLLRALNWRGIAMVEFKGTEKDYRLMEINPRVWGSYPLTRAAKSRFSMNYALACAGEEPSRDPLSGPGYTPGVRMKFFLQEAACAAEYLKRRRPLASLRALGSAVNPFVRDGVLEMSDCRASLEYIKATIRRLK